MLSMALRLVLPFLVAALVMALAVDSLVGDVSSAQAEQDALRVAAQAEQLVLEPGDLRGPLPDQRLAELDAALATLSVRQVSELKLYAPDGTVLWAADRRDVGDTSHRGDEEFARLLAGAQPSVSVRQGLSGISASTEREGDQLYETYAVVATADGTAGIFEIYQDYRPTVSLSNQLRSRILAWSLLGLGLIFLTVLPVTHRMQGRLRRQRDELHSRTAELDAALARAREASQLKDTLLQAVSHELRTPLAVVVGAMETLERPDLVDPATRDLLVARAAAQARRLDRIFHDLLDVGRLERGLTDARRQVVHDLDQLVDRTVREVAAPEHQVRATVSVSEAWLDPAQLERCIENLVANAVRHTPPGCVVDVNVAAEGDDLMLIVEDDGPGIPIEDRTRVLEAFARGPNPEHAPGTGIGLHVVAHFASLHGGDVVVESSATGGARLVVRFPDAAGASVPTAPPTPATN